MASLIINPHTCDGAHAQQKQSSTSSRSGQSVVAGPHDDNVPTSVFIKSEFRKVLPPRCDHPFVQRRSYSTDAVATLKKAKLPLSSTPHAGATVRHAPNGTSKPVPTHARPLHTTAPTHTRKPAADAATPSPDTKHGKPGQRLKLDTINPNVVRAQYAVRGELAVRAERYRVMLETHGPRAGLPFDSVIFANIGNPQQLDQKPITFFRQVLSIVENPALLALRAGGLAACGYEADVFARAEALLRDVGSVGAYSQSAGIPLARRSVARYLAERDGEPADPDDIFLTAGASAGVNTLLNVICGGPQTGVLIPIPQYPLYTATLAVLNAQCVPYHLDERDGWATDVAAIERSLADARARGIDVRAIAVINPGNPTGSSLTPQAVTQVLQLAARERLVVLADEVYQTNVFSGAADAFTSFKKALRALQRAHPDGRYSAVELASLNSVSKGMVGECGHRGGYFELVGFDRAVREQIYKFVSVGLCPPVVGQCLVELAVNPPKKGEPSYPRYHAEYTHIKTQMRARAMALYDAFRQMRGVSCAEPSGSMYLYPQLTLPARAVAAAREAGVPPDDFYCGKLLDATGICVVPGSGFGQVEGTFHLRTTFLAPGTAWVSRIVEFHERFWREYGDE